MALKDNITITLEELKNYLKVENTEDDSLINDLLESACEAAENFMGQDFTGETVPKTVIKWIKKRIAKDYEIRTEGMVKQRLGDESIEIVREDYSDLTPYRINPGF